MPREALMTVAEVSDYLRCSVSMVRRLARGSQIPYFRVGRLVRFRRSDVDAWLAAHHEGASSTEGGQRRPSSHPDQLFLFGGESGRGA